MRTTKVAYSLTRRQSQSRIGAIYQDIIREKYELNGDTETADVVIIQHPAWHYQLSYQMNPHLNNKYVIAYCVAHADDIPASWKRSLSLVQEVWSCSDYCCEVFSKYHSNVAKVPYIVERATTAPDKIVEFTKRLIGYDPKCVYFLTIAPIKEPRKNIHALVDSFNKVSKSIPNARLIIKASPDDRVDWDSHEQVILLPMTLPHEYINALYQLADVYVSPHHSESWGTTISDAILFNKPVIATGYSGNLEYMDAADSFLLSYHYDMVPSNVRGVSIEDGMRWGAPDPESLEENLVRLYASHNSPETLEKVARASQRVKSFNRQRAAAIIYDRIDKAAGRSAAAESSAKTVESSIA
jgi:glycosyltransferase involved in cell wall biosynthesis